MKNATSKLMLIAAALAVAQPAAQRDWGSFGQDPGGTKHSTLNQITTENVKSLTRAWVFHTGDSTGFFESTPIVVDSVMYFSTTQAVFALDAVTGQQIWKYETTGTARRGPTYWAGGNGIAPRLFTSSADGLAALDAKTGTLVTSFGTKGVIPGVRVSSPPAIYRNVLITQGGASTVKAWDTVTGEPR
jgi:glucose dehydrogenase